MQHEVDALAKLLSPTTSEQAQQQLDMVSFVKGVVTAVGATTATVQFAESDDVSPAPIAGIGYLHRPQVGEVVTVAVQGVTRLIIGTIGAAAGEKVEIYDTLLSGDVANGGIDWQSIPSGFKHLKIVVTARTTSTNNSERIAPRFNNDSGNNYDWQWSAGNGSGMASGRTPATSAGHIGDVPAANDSSNDAGIYEILIPNYALTSFNKTWVSSGGYAFQYSTPFNLHTFGSWRNTAAINRITWFTGSGGSFKAGSRFTLYGIK